MRYFFELSVKQAGYSRIGRIILSKETKSYINTPEIVIPMKRTLMNHLGFLEEFQEHKLFLLTKEIYLKIGFLREKFKDTGFIFTHNGTLSKFNEILARNLEKISENNVICIIPFSIPTTSINKDFAINEIIDHLNHAKKLISKYPNIIFGLSIRIFDYPELIEFYFSFIKEASNIKLLNFLDLFDNFLKYRRILEALIQIKSNLDNNLVLMASGKIVPNQYPFLVYLGIDLINPAYMLYLSSENFYNTVEFLLPIYKIQDFPCSCFACSGELRKIKEVKYSGEKIELLSLHNINSANNQLNKIKQYLKTEDFRNFVEKAVLNDLNLISALKILDKIYYDHINYETPVTQKNKKVNCIGALSYNRPDFRYFRKRLLQTFTPEPWTRLILIYPCSSKKPYSISKSHRAFQKIMRRFPDFPNFQEIILTSPLGAIPRQYEDIYPVNSYDISVTGIWDSEELKITANMLKELLKTYNENIPIICHLKGIGYHKVIKRVQKSLNHKFYFSEVKEKLTSKESLDSLYEKIKGLKDIYQPQENIPLKNRIQKSWDRKLLKIVDYQLGKGMGIKLIQNGCKIKKDVRTNKLLIYEKGSNKFLGHFSIESGQVELKLNFLNNLNFISNFDSCIVFDGNKITGSTLFRPGIVEFSSELKPGQVVIILNKDKKEAIGLGYLTVGKNYIKNTTSGKIVEIYEKL